MPMQRHKPEQSVAVLRPIEVQRASGKAAIPYAMKMAVRNLVAGIFHTSPKSSTT